MNEYDEAFQIFLLSFCLFRPDKDVQDDEHFENVIDPNRNGKYGPNGLLDPKFNKRFVGIFDDECPGGSSLHTLLIIEFKLFRE